MIHAFGVTFGVLLALFVFFNFKAVLRFTLWTAFAIFVIILVFAMQH